ncbi:MAG: DUF2971 domain-containing protein [Eubacteriales bacterium]
MTPETLYHYTSIESLAHILDTKRIKFNRLDKMDDILDGNASDIKHISKFYYISSWTSYEKESLAFWNMYTPNMSGVRIGLKLHPFNYYLSDVNKKINHDEYEREMDVSPFFDFEEYRFPIDLVMMFHPELGFLRKVNYVKAEELKVPKFLNVNNDTYAFALSEIGRYKTEHWAFQEEWRYMLYYIPNILFENDLRKMKKNEVSKIIETIENTENKVDAVYMDISTEYFEKMEILIGPKAKNADEIIIKSLIEKYNPKACIKKSELTGKIR